MESAVFFYFRFLGRKKTALFSQKKKSALFFYEIDDFGQKKTALFYHNFRPPYFYQNCRFQTIEPTIYFWQKLTLSDGNKKYRLISAENKSISDGNKKIPIIFAKTVKKYYRK